MSHRNLMVLAFRYAARVGSLATLAFIGMFFIGELTNGEGVWPSLTEWIAVAFFPCGMLIGMGIAWRRELLGGVITIASIAAFYAWDFILSGRPPSSAIFIVLGLPGLLFVLASMLDRDS